MPVDNQYPELTGLAASDDTLLGIDVSDHTTSPYGRTKRFPVSSLPGSESVTSLKGFIIGMSVAL